MMFAGSLPELRSVTSISVHWPSTCSVCCSKRIWSVALMASLQTSAEATRDTRRNAVMQSSFIAVSSQGEPEESEQRVAVGGGTAEPVVVVVPAIEAGIAGVLQTD